jgi:hypothetical protein
VKRMGWICFLIATAAAAPAFGEVGLAGIRAESWPGLFAGALVVSALCGSGLFFSALAAGFLGSLVFRAARRLLPALALLSVGWLLCASDAAEFDAGTNAVKVLPERNLPRNSGTPWAATNSAAQGEILRYGLNAYMALNEGTLGTNAPVFVAGSETNGTVVLSVVPIGPRRGMVIQLLDAGPLKVRVYSPSHPGWFRLIGENSSWSESGDGAPQGAVFVESMSGTNTVSALEW